MKVALLLISLLVSVLSQTAEEDQVLNVDIPEYTHPYYSGMLQVSIEDSIHYTFYESQNNSNKDPLLIYLAGGPGCSSMAPMFHENGPFIFLPGSMNLTLNPNAWNKKANVLYLELPAGVGFSETTTPGKPLNDVQTAMQAYHSLRQFYIRFPNYRGRDLYLTGHGYAAVYHAYLAARIIEHNEDPFEAQDDKINLKGLLLGNPCVLEDECYASGSGKKSYYHYEFLYKRAFFTTHQWDQFRGSCVLDYDDFDCYQERQKLDAFFNSTNSSSLNIYDKCYKTVNGTNVINSGCEDEAGVINHVSSILFKSNWHVNQSKNWEVCSKHVYDMYEHGNNSYWLMPHLIEKKLRLWVYSGDFDSEVPITGTKKWISFLHHEHKLPLKKIWREWWIPGTHTGEDQVGGHVWEMEGLTFATVRGAGLRSGIDKPESMEEMLDNFLKGSPLPKNPNLDPTEF